MSKYKQIHTGEDGWSDWEYPIMKGYKMGCCDCGLVHNMDFEIRRITNRFPDGSFESIPVDGDEEYIVRFKVSRNERATGQKRRHMRKKGGEEIC